MIASSGRQGRPLQHLKRFREVTSILARYGFTEILQRLGIRTGLRGMDKTRARELKMLATYSRVRRAIEELGPTFIKFGQILSNRPDVVPPELIRELSLLQSSVPPFPGAEAVATIEKELGRPLNEVFSTFDSVPVASASIAQVHSAYLHTGERVALKVRRPKIERTIRIDTEIMMRLATLAERHIAQFREIGIVALVAQFRETILRELDFNTETCHIERFRNHFASDRDIKVPLVYKEFSAARLITMEYINGISLNAAFSGGGIHFDPKDIARRGTNLVLRQIFDYGFFHADPHPGNIFITNDLKICFLDFGMMGHISGRYRQYLADLMVGFVQGNHKAVCAVLLEMAVNHRVTDRDEFENQIAGMLDQFAFMNINQINMGRMLQQTMDIVMRYRIQMPPQIFLLVKSLVTIEGVARQLDEGFNILEKIKPYALRLVRQRYSPRRLLMRALEGMGTVVRMFDDMPDDLREALSRLKRGELAVPVELRMSRDLWLWKRYALRQTNHTIVFAALLLSSALFGGLSVAPLWLGISIPAALTFILAFIFLISLLLRKRR